MMVKVKPRPGVVWTNEWWEPVAMAYIHEMPNGDYIAGYHKLMDLSRLGDLTRWR